MPCDHRGRTATFEFETASGDYTELQCGSYTFLVPNCGRNLDRDGDLDDGVRAEPFRVGNGDDPPGAARWSMPTSKRSPSIFGSSLVPDETATSYERPPPTSTAGPGFRAPRSGSYRRPIPNHCDHERGGRLAVDVRHADLDMPATPQQIWHVNQVAHQPVD
jgi:hypothetical protein